MFKPITEFILNYISSESSRFHTPGHKSSTNIFFKKIEMFDITEIDGSDNLLKPEGIIKTSEEIASNIYDSYFSLFSAGGSTLSIQTMLFTAAKRNSKVIAMRNSHISFINTCCLLGIDPIWIYPKYQDRDGVSGIVDLDVLEEFIKNNIDVSCVYITSPDYLGTIQDIASIARLTKKYGILLLVDNAHGAHLKFLKPDIHPISLGADICCDSLHKTLPALTGAAILHFKTKIFRKDQVKSNMAYFASTSPSYPILASIEYALEYMICEFPRDIKDILACVDELRFIADKIGFEFSNFASSPLHFVLDFSSIGIDTKYANSIFLKNNIQVEFVSSTHIVLLIAKYNLERDIKNLVNTLYLFKNKNDSKKLLEKNNFKISAPKKELTPMEAIFSPSTFIDIDDCLGKIVTQTSFKCPPGIPLIMPGEVVNSCILKHLKNSGVTKIKVVE